MELGLQISNFTWKGRGPKLGETLANVSRLAEDVGYTSIWVMDHLFQIPPIGSARMEMLEAYTALGFIAANTNTARVGTMEEAVRAAARFAQSGDTVLLSPACSSLDMFRDYAHRGNVFAAAVKELAPSERSGEQEKGQ